MNQRNERRASQLRMRGETRTIVEVPAAEVRVGDYLVIGSGFLTEPRAVEVTNVRGTSVNLYFSVPDWTMRTAVVPSKGRGSRVLVVREEA